MIWLFIVVIVTLVVVASVILFGSESNLHIHRETNNTDIQIWTAHDVKNGTATVLRVKLAIACMTRHPLAIESWLNHHRNTVGVDHFFICVEDSPDVERLLRRKYSHCVTMTSNRNSDATPGYFSLMDRQAAHVNRSIELARQRGFTHLVHIDDDELLFCPSGVDAFKGCLGGECEGFSSLHMSNIEAVYEASDCKDPFSTAEWFCIRPKLFTAYVNGKSIGTLSDKKLKMKGPHAFTGSTKNIPPHVAVVAHYESACYDRWKDKFESYAKDTPDACASGRIPFPFYCASIDAASGADSDKEKVWEQWKTRDAKREGIIHTGVLLNRSSL